MVRSTKLWLNVKAISFVTWCRITWSIWENVWYAGDENNSLLAALFTATCTSRQFYTISDLHCVPIWQRVIAPDAFIRTNRRAIAMTFVRPSVCLSVCLGRACIVIIRCTLARISLGWIVQCLGTLTSKHVHLLPAVFSTWKRGGVWMCKVGVIFQERLKLEVKLLLSANKKS